jgi:hypothetical protein
VQNYFWFGKCLVYLPCIKFAESKVSNPFDLAKSAAPAPTNTHGGTRPRAPSFLCPRHISLATLQGFFSPPAAPTAPQSLEAPSITEASHSTVPSQVRFDPYPAFVNELSSKMATASVAASNAFRHEDLQSFEYSLRLLSLCLPAPKVIHHQSQKYLIFHLIKY